MLKLLLNLAIVFFVAAFARRVIRNFLRPKDPTPPPRTEDRTGRKPEVESDLGQGQKIEEAEYEDLP